MGARAASLQHLHVTITVTNPPATGDSITINGVTRYWTNAEAATTILTNLTGFNASKTNLFRQFSRWGFTGPQLSLVNSSTNAFQLYAPIGSGLTASASGTWATILITTQANAYTYTAVYPLENIIENSNQIEEASSLARGISSYSTNAFATNSVAASNFLSKGASPVQRVVSPVLLNSYAGTNKGFIMPSNAVAGYVLTVDASGVGTWQAITGGSGSSNVFISLSTNGISVTPLATNQNFIFGNNLYQWITNDSGNVSLHIGVSSNLNFNAAGFQYMLGSDDDQQFGFSNKTTGRWSFWNAEGSDDNWLMSGTLTASNLNLTTLSGTGPIVGVNAFGQLYRTTGSAISNSHLIFVDTGGDNSTAVRGHRELAYATPVAAKAAALVGDTIVVYPGVYQNCSNLMKRGVNWQGYGATLCWTNTTNDIGYGIFDDRFSGSTTSKIAGFSFRYSTGFETTNILYAPAYGPTNYLGCLVVTNPTSQVTFDFDRIDYQSVKSAADAAAAIWLGGGTNCFISGNLIHDVNLTTNYFIGVDQDLAADVLLESKAIGVYWTGGEHHIDIKRILCKFNSFYAGGADNKVGNAWVNGDFYFGQFYVAGSATQPNWRVWANVKELQCNRTNNNSAGAITFGFGGKLYFTAEKVSESGTLADPAGIAITQLPSSSTCESWFTIQKVSASGNWITGSSGTMHADIQHFEDLGSVNRGINVVGAKVFLTGVDATVTNATGSAFYHSAGDVQITGMRLSATNSSSAPVLLATNGASLVSCTLLGKAAGFSIAGSSAVSANLQGCWGRTSESNNVSYLVGPWTVDSNVR